MIRLKEQVKAWMGPLWWYSAVMFCVQRFGDVINMFIGLWLVPKYVPASELGAVLPLAQVGSVLGLPLAVLMIPFTKFLNTYATHGEFGKVKCLLRDVFVLTAVLIAGTLVCSRFFMPLVFERMRVVEGSLGVLIVASGMISIVASVFGTALQGLKQFRIIAITNLLAAPLRLIVMLVCMPFRAISGYFVGQSAPSALVILASLFGLRRQLNRQVKAEPYWLEDWRAILRYTIPVAVYVVTGAVQIMVEAFVIRHRLPDVDSAGYYVISRFSDIGAYAGMSFVFVLFPLAAENYEQGGRSHRLLWQSMGGALGIGLLLVVGIHVFGRMLLGLSNAWADYVTYAPQLTALTLIVVMRVVCACFVNFEMACGRFGFVSYYVFLSGIQSVLLYSITGYSFFEGWLPTGWIAWMASLRAARLDFLIKIMLWFSVSTFVCSLLHLGIRIKRFAKI